MERKTRIILLAVALLLAAMGVASWTATEHYAQGMDAKLNVTAESLIPVDMKVHAVHRRMLVADMHADSLLLGRDLLERSSVGHVDLPRLREGNVAVQAFTVATQAPSNINIDHASG